MTELRHPRPEDFLLTEIFKVLSNPVQLEILVAVSKADNQPCDLFVESIPESSAIHWSSLREAGLIRTVEHGAQRLHSLRRKELNERYPGLLDAVLVSAEG